MIVGIAPLRTGGWRSSNDMSGRLALDLVIVDASPLTPEGDRVEPRRNRSCRAHRHPGTSLHLSVGSS